MRPIPQTKPQLIAEVAPEWPRFWTARPGSSPGRGVGESWSAQALRLGQGRGVQRSPRSCRGTWGSPTDCLPRPDSRQPSMAAAPPRGPRGRPEPRPRDLLGSPSCVCGRGTSLARAAPMGVEVLARAGSGVAATFGPGSLEVRCSSEKGVNAETRPSSARRLSRVLITRGNQLAWICVKASEMLPNLLSRKARSRAGQPAMAVASNARNKHHSSHVRKPSECAPVASSRKRNNTGTSSGRRFWPRGPFAHSRRKVPKLTDRTSSVRPPSSLSARTRLSKHSSRPP
mmetsp:Transcript_95159/g.307261  ORF Transcript_95159/g.307261 Transcript_95159/m.307261 type:complete len:286 (-) Transcript_95159:885-1742(-)